MPGFPIPDPFDSRHAPIPSPAQMMHFAPTNPGRPGPVSAVGGIGTVVGIVGIIASLVLFAAAGGLISVSATSASSAKQFAPAALPVSKPDQPVMMSFTPAPLAAGPRGLAAGDRDILLLLIVRAIALSPQQSQQFDALMREAGADIFPGTPPTGDAAMSAALRDRGTMPTATPTASPTVFFITNGGRAEIYDDRAVFHPAGGSGTVRVAAGPRANATGHPILRQEDVGAVIDLIRQASGGKLNPAQTKTLTDMLKSPDQELVCLCGSSDAPVIGITGAGPQPGGYLLVGFAGGSLLLTPDGRPLLKDDPMPGVSVLACIGTMIIALIGMIMAIWLVILSRRLLKQTLLTPRFHRRWARLKIVIALAAGVMFGWMIDSFLASRPGADGTMYRGIAAGLALFAAGCVFPAIVMVMFRKRSARLYFDGVM